MTRLLGFVSFLSKAVNAFKIRHRCCRTYRAEPLGVLMVTRPANMTLPDILSHCSKFTRMVHVNENDGCIKEVDQSEIEPSFTAKEFY